MKRAGIRNTVCLTADMHYTAAHRYDPNRAVFQDFEPFCEFVSGPLHAGTWAPAPLDNTFGPAVAFQKGCSAEQGEKLARALGPHHAVLMRAHGLTLGAESIPALLVDAVHFDENARAQMQVMQAGRKPLALTEAEMEQINRHEMRDFHCGKLWTYYVRKGEKSGALPPDWQVG